MAREHQLSDRQVREIVRHMRDAVEPASDPSPDDIVDRVLAAIEDAIRELAEAADSLTGVARVRAISARLKAIEGHFRVNQRAGRVPTGPERFVIERDIERTVETILDVFERHNVPIEVQLEIRDLLRGGRITQTPENPAP